MIEILTLFAVFAAGHVSGVITVHAARRRLARRRLQASAAPRVQIRAPRAPQAVRREVTA